jgi:hypothetical protein
MCWHVTGGKRQHLANVKLHASNAYKRREKCPVLKNPLAVEKHFLIRSRAVSRCIPERFRSVLDPS